MKVDRKKIFNMFDGRCAYCGYPITIDNFQVDHILAKHKGGKDEEDNYYPACRSCNASKATFTIEGFRKKLRSDIGRIRRDSPKFRILERFGLVEVPESPELIFEFERYMSLGEGIK